MNCYQSYVMVHFVLLYEFNVDFEIVHCRLTLINAHVEFLFEQYHIDLTHHSGLLMINI